MNNQNDTFNQENHITQENALKDRKIREMEEEIELLREQVKSLKEELRYEYERSNEYLEELAHTNQELELMNKEICNLIASNTQPIDEVKELPESIIKKKKSVSESVAKLGNTIDSSPVEVNKSEQIDGSSVGNKFEKFKAQAHETRANSAKIKARYSQITTECYRITTQSQELRGCSREIKAHSHEVRNQVASVKVSSEASLESALYP